MKIYVYDVTFSLLRLFWNTTVFGKPATDNQRKPIDIVRKGTRPTKPANLRQRNRETYSIPLKTDVCLARRNSH